MGRRAHRPDDSQRRQVEALAGYGIPEADIAGVIGIDPKTLRKHYRGELDHGHTKANARVAENLYRKATGDGREAVTAAIFWLKTRARWSETQVHQHAFISAEPLSPEEWERQYGSPTIDAAPLPPAGKARPAIDSTPADGGR